jgi:hypothetical protein
MNPSNPWFRLLVGIVATAIAIRLALDLIRPVFGLLLAVIAIAGAVAAIRWWRNNRW